MGLFGNDYSLGGFIAGAARNGLPVGFLREVVKSYTLKRTDDGKDETKPGINRLYFSTNTLDSIATMDPDIPFGEAPGIQTIYHEATHAYLDLKDDDPTVVRVLAECNGYYKDGKLSNGKATNDPERVTQEAAASYVGHRAATYWMALEKLVVFEARIGRVEKQERLWHAIKSIPGEYNMQMGKRVFGYQELGPVWNSEQYETTKVVPSALKLYCDQKLLENKLPDQFAAVSAFRERYLAICSRRPGMDCSM